jgi:hypothetical protein
LEQARGLTFDNTPESEPQMCQHIFSRALEHVYKNHEGILNTTSMDEPVHEIMISEVGGSTVEYNHDLIRTEVQTTSIEEPTVSNLTTDQLGIPDKGDVELLRHDDTDHYLKTYIYMDE